MLKTPSGRALAFGLALHLAAACASAAWQAGANHTYTVPASGVGFVNVNWQY